jgi:hypothetical protein
MAIFATMGGNYQMRIGYNKMQMPTHLITGVLIDEVVKYAKIPPKGKKISVVVLNLFSHGLLDALSKSTYHPPEPLPNDTFWVFYHRIILPTLSFIVLIKFWKEHKFSMLISILPDLDWVVRDINLRFDNMLPFWNNPVLNQGLVSLVSNFPLFKWVNLLPDWRHIKTTVVIEGILIGVISIFIWLLKEKTNGSPQKTL